MLRLLVPVALLVGLTTELPPEAAVKPEKIADVTAYCEGVVVDAEGNIYFSVCATGNIIKIDTQNQMTVWAKTPEPNGHKIRPDGTHVVCDAKAHAVLQLDAQGKMLEPASKECEGQPLRGPNDLTLDLPNGGIYFTDPGGSSAAKPIGTVHYVDRAGKTHRVAGELAFPNGIVLRPDGYTLLVAESGKNHVLQYEVIRPGKTGRMNVFAELPKKGEGQIDNQPDGMCLDEEGNLYIAHFGMRQVQVVSPEGKVIRRYPGGNLTTSNVAFGGPNFDQLYITGSIEKDKPDGGLFRLDLKGVKGLRLLPAK